MLVVNADDWGRDTLNTDRIADCIRRGTVSSTSAMVFMEDSERSATIARERNVDTGLHLNYTTAFSAPTVPSKLAERQNEVTRYLRKNRVARLIYNPMLARSFAYVTAAQIDEYRRLYGKDPARLDGHHHMHLCANVLLGGLLPKGTLVRRNFTFLPGEKSLPNRLSRSVVDRILARNHRVVDYFFSLPPLEPAERLQRIWSLARDFTVEVETHPVNSEEYKFLVEGEILARFQDLKIERAFNLNAATQRVEARA
jgi:predicted glycoside hydrolase/deacetylase ChbG (UPF0249 family)